MTQKSKFFLTEKNVQITKQEHDFKSYASTHDVEILGFF